MWLSSKERVGASAGAVTGSGLKVKLGRPSLEPDSGTGDNSISGGIIYRREMLITFTRLSESRRSFVVAAVSGRGEQEKKMKSQRSLID